MSRQYLRCFNCRKVGVASEMVVCCNRPDVRPFPISKTEARARDREALRRHFARQTVSASNPLVPAWRRWWTWFLMWLRKS